MANVLRSVPATAQPLARRLALVVGVVLLVVGVAGFIPGITTHYDMLSFAGHASGAKLFGVFQVSILHNIVHLLFGVVGLALSRSSVGATHYLIWGGIIYAVVWF